MSIIVSHSYSTEEKEAEKSEDVWNRLNDLTKLSKLNIIPKPEYEVRKQQLVDELTGTKIKKNNCQTNDVAVDFEEPPAGSIPPLRDVIQRKQSVAAGTRTLKKSRLTGDKKAGLLHKFPDFTQIPSQRARVLKFNLEEGRFDHAGEIIEVKIDPTPFARGNLRLAHHMLACLSDSDKRRGVQEHYVAKISIDPFEDPKSYLDDVATQQCAREYAKMYNRYNPPKTVKFVEAFVISLIDRPRAPLCAVEPFIDGTYKKHNNNWGFINNKHERNTPHAFSHFTYEASQHQLLICDIQGVADIYTDPQIHSIDGRGYGKGNMGTRGFRKFFSTHRCNAICKFLKLPLINPKDPQKELLTVPQKALMENDQVENVNLGFSGSLNALPALPAFKSTSQMKAPLISKEKEGGTCCRCALL
mmetsp:Transcript_9902/g.13784  ORF Transcript_9902/g.13784 Transcript_9902/m.13784 type:complete len:415 (+) Transcript_9902:103-1347(+)|eukprot:CAMPEP_0184487768 /NCGR_PEP_ID=MMETSP0113_2-20130426/10324_1 /TAXON_ID=91329 /ORGANISM="Norrisiella sphaerica, Strain BC52" /LENGTH=414 /DNA_ID=CAMNT_0026870173 /DNA_START=105 /DNA_END=1349 /DNA_ORIENTATION=-